jgi:hypothetical protein
MCLSIFLQAIFTIAEEYNDLFESHFSNRNEIYSARILVQPSSAPLISFAIDPMLNDEWCWCTVTLNLFKLSLGRNWSINGFPTT